jgi:hypothetical protein
MSKASSPWPGKGRRRHPSRLRLSFREPGPAARLRTRRHHLHRPQRGTAGTAGRQTAARRLAQSAGIPVVPGTEAGHRNARQAEKIAGEIGFPLIVKAAFGGGGRGMRVVDRPPISPGAGRSPARSRRRFRQRRGVSGTLRAPRPHIEVQILGDRARQHPAPLRARLLGAAPPSKGGGSGARRVLDPALRARWPKPPSPGARRRLLQRRHRRVPGGCRFGRVVLHRSQPAHPGGTHRHRDGDRHRPGALPDPSRAGPGVCTARR